MKTSATSNRKTGTYALFLTLSEDLKTETGSLGEVLYEAGEYCYTGSAMNGLEHRISRHLAKEKKIRWHIDRLTLKATSMTAYVSEGKDCIPECSLADAAKELGFIPYVKGFGSSDCGCYTHLFRIPPGGRERMVEFLGLKPFIR